MCVCACACARMCVYKQFQEGVNQIASHRENPCVAGIPSEERTFVCQCGRTFRRTGDLTRHQSFCNSRLQKPRFLPGAQPLAVGDFRFRFRFRFSVCVCVCVCACVCVRMCVTYCLSYVNGNASLSEKAPNPTLKLVVRFLSVSTKTTSIICIVYYSY